MADAFRQARPRGYTQEEMAQALFAETGETVGKNTLNNWERGNTKLPAHMLLAAATIAGESIDQLLSKPAVWRKPRKARGRLDDIEG